MPEQINYRRHGLIRAPSFALASADFGLFASPSAFSGAGFDSEGGMPPLDGATEWLNSAPLTTDSLRGKVVVVDFWTYTCINWVRTLPYIRAWAGKYREHGLVVIGVHTPEFPFEHDLRNLRRAVQEMRITYPVVVDNDYAIWEAFDNHYWPALYLIDAEGRIRHQQFGEGDYEEAERTIQQLLTEAGVEGIDQGLVEVDAQGAEVAADWSHLASGETYLGHERTDGFASPGGAVVGEQAVYAVPEQLARNEWALSGTWTIQPGLVALNSASGRIAYRFHARDVHLVMGPAAPGTTVRFRVYLDGRPAGAAHGSDVDVQGAGMVREQRLYQLIRQQGRISDRLFEIDFLDPGVEAYVFTFG
ncbi:MAG TPA: thioredoxin family protein [Ktedonobacterales bacterium]